ncbi:hypothetical protein IEQ34_002477 [Dendrobium chrysotoxum]|uniref:Core-2/I-branching beta-1,6-N-acetylglucosaminyltransferase family protein n=1 Tax=Dendrobium chrysotoxum TaxID=161865 RepID=A0AAV7H516_DENCH|nr:hypothetical protein IEQ34_002477 [Dendrobium chrysotoxum]
MKRRSYGIRLRTKLAVLLSLSFCIGTLVLIRKQHDRILSLDNLDSSQPHQKPKIAFLFIARNRLPLDVIWDAFFKEQEEGKFSIYVHSRPGFLFNQAKTKSRYFYGRQVNNSIQVDWGEASMILAERILLQNALKDATNERFLFLSDRLSVWAWLFGFLLFPLLWGPSVSPSGSFYVAGSFPPWLPVPVPCGARSCLPWLPFRFPVWLFGYCFWTACWPSISPFLIGSLTMVVNFPFSNVLPTHNPGSSFADTKEGRYNPKMHLVIPMHNWRKGSQWAVLIRKHAEIIVNDTTVLPEFQKHCREVSEVLSERRSVWRGSSRESAKDSPPSLLPLIVNRIHKSNVDPIEVVFDGVVEVKNPRRRTATGGCQCCRLRQVPIRNPMRTLPFMLLEGCQVMWEEALLPLIFFPTRMAVSFGKSRGMKWGRGPAKEVSEVLSERRSVWRGSSRESAKDSPPSLLPLIVNRIHKSNVDPIEVVFDGVVEVKNPRRRTATGGCQCCRLRQVPIRNPMRALPFMLLEGCQVMWEEALLPLIFFPMRMAVSFGKSRGMKWGRGPAKIDDHVSGRLSKCGCPHQKHSSTRAIDKAFRSYNQENSLTNAQSLQNSILCRQLDRVDKVQSINANDPIHSNDDRVECKYQSEGSIHKRFQNATQTPAKSKTAQKLLKSSEFKYLKLKLNHQPLKVKPIHSSQQFAEVDKYENNCSSQRANAWSKISLGSILKQSPANFLLLLAHPKYPIDGPPSVSADPSKTGKSEGASNRVVRTLANIRANAFSEHRASERRASNVFSGHSGELASSERRVLKRLLASSEHPSSKRPSERLRLLPVF